MRARARSKAMWLNSVSLGRFEVAGWGGCGGCGDGWASLMKVHALDVVATMAVAVTVKRMAGRRREARGGVGM